MASIKEFETKEGKPRPYLSSHNAVQTLATTGRIRAVGGQTI